MADQEFLASYAVDIDEQGVDRLQAILESNRSLAESLSAAFQTAWADLSEFVRQASASVTGFSQFESAQERAAGQAVEAEQAIAALTQAYSGLTAAIPSDSLDLSVTGHSDSSFIGLDLSGLRESFLESLGTGADFLGASGVTQSISAEMPHLLDTLRTGSVTQIKDLDASSERNESGRKTSEFSGYLTEISASVGRMVTLLAGSDNDSDSGSSSGRGAAAAAGGMTDLNLDLSGAGESLQSFLQSLTSSEAEIPAGLNLTGAEEDLFGLQASAAGTKAVMPLRMDRTRAEATLQDLQRLFRDPLNLTADASGVLNTASSALASIQSQYSRASLNLTATITTQTGDDGGSGDTPSGRGNNSPLVSALRSSTGGRFTRPTQLEVAEDGDPEYVIPVEKESMAVPLLRQALSDLSASAREALLSGLGGNGASALASLPEYLASAPAAATGSISVQNTQVRSVEAPVNINVTASGTSAEDISRSVYDAASRYLQKTIRSAIA